MNQSVSAALSNPAAARDVLTYEERFALRRCFCEANGKGGAGKTSVTCETACKLAAAGYKVLVVDLDPQGNVGVDLGYQARGLDDGGQALFTAVATVTEPMPLKNVRANLDVLPGGDMTGDLSDWIVGRSFRGDNVRGSVARALAKIAHRYDFIFIDTPPLYPGLLDEALLAARWVIIPTGPDTKDIAGIAKLDTRITRARELNPTVELLGVVLFRIPAVARGVNQTEMRARQDIEEFLGDEIPTFTATIRDAVAANTESSARGQVSSELSRDRDAEGEGAWFKYLRGELKERPIAKSAVNLAEDYAALAQEINDEIAKQEELIAASLTLNGEAHD